MAYVVTLGCVDVKDKSCIQECPVDCIYEGERMMYIHPAECIDCGACEPVCPQEAISYEEEINPVHEPFIAANTDFFAELGTPRGSKKFADPLPDVPMVATLALKPDDD